MTFVYLGSTLTSSISDSLWLESTSDDSLSSDNQAQPKFYLILINLLKVKNGVLI